MPGAGLALVGELGSPALKHDGAIRQVAVTPDGKRIISIGDGASVHVWNADTGQRAFDLAAGERALYALAISQEGHRVLAGGHDLSVFDLRTKQRVAAPTVRKPPVVAAAFAPDGGFVFGDDRVARRFDARGNELAPLGAHQIRISALAVSRDGRRALTCGGDRKIKLHALDAREPVVIATWDGHARSCGFSPDGTLAWSVGWDHATVRGTTSGRVTFEDRLANMRAGALALDGSRLAIAADEGVVIYELPGKRVAARLAYVADALAFTPDGKRLVVAPAIAGRGAARGTSGGSAESIATEGGSGASVFDIASERRVLPTGAGHTGSVEGLAIAAAMPHALFSIGAEGDVVMWDLDTGTAIERIGGVRGAGRAIACTADGATLYTTSADSGLVAWSVARTEGAPVAGSGTAGVDIAIAPGGRYVAYVSATPRELQIYDRTTHALVARTQASRAQRGGTLAFAAADVVVASADVDTAAAVRLPDGVRAWAISGDGFINALCVAGSAVILGGAGGSLGIWDAATGVQRSVLRETGREIQRLCAVDADHVALLQRSQDFDSSTLEVWSLPARRVLGRTDLAVRARSLVASPDGRRVYVGTNTSRVLVFERS